MPSTAPSAAPDDAPRMSGDTSGLRNRPWNAVPATASAAPTSAAASTRGPRTCQITFSTRGAARRRRWPVSFAERRTREADRQDANGIAPDRERQQQPGDQRRPKAISRPGSGGAGHAAQSYQSRPASTLLDLRVGRRHMIEAPCRNRGVSAPMSSGKLLRIEDLGEPPQPDQPVDRRREVDPAERHLRRQMHPPGAHRRDLRPHRIAAHARGEIAVDGDDDIGIPQQHLLDRDDREPALALGRDIARAEKLDGLDVDRAAEPGLQPARPARVVDARPLALAESFRPAP